MPDFESYGVKRCVDKLGRIVLPREFRDELQLTAGSPVRICLINGGILIKPDTEKN